MYDSTQVYFWGCDPSPTATLILIFKYTRDSENPKVGHCTKLLESGFKAFLEPLKLKIFLRRLRRRKMSKMPIFGPKNALKTSISNVIF